MSAANETGVTASAANETGVTASAANETDASVSAPVLRIVGGHPTDEDVAILVAVLGSAGGGSAPSEPASRDLWGSPVDRLRPADPLAPAAFPNLRFGY